MEIDGVKYSADLRYDGLRFVLIEPFSDIDKNSLFSAKPGTPSGDDEYVFSELDVRIRC